MKNFIKTLVVLMALALVLVACELPFIGGGDNPTPTLPSTECKHIGGIATCLSPATCQACGETYGAKGECIVVNVPAVDPTCSRAGSTASSLCSICGQIFVRSAAGR